MNEYLCMNFYVFNNFLYILNIYYYLILSNLALRINKKIYNNLVLNNFSIKK